MTTFTALPPRYLALSEAAELAGVSTRTLRRAIAAGKLPAHRIGRLIRIEADDFCNWVEEPDEEPVSARTLSS